MNKTPIFGAGTDFSIAADGYIAQFITDAGDPNSLLIPAGNWNFETYFNASSSGGTPSFYVELYKYDGTTFTLIASNSANPEFIAFGTIVNPYFSALAVPETILTITDRLAVRIYVVTSGKTITLHTENSNLCQVITTFSRGVTALNGLTEQVQYFQVGTSGTDFNIASATATHTFNLPTASAVNRGALSSADWAIFNGKQNAITLTTTGTSGVSTLVGSTLNIPNYSTDLSGYVTLDTTQTITGFKTILRGGDVLNFKIGTDTLYGLKVAYNQNELAPSGEATWSFVNTFNNGSGTGLETTPISFFRGVLVTGERLVSASVNTNLLNYYASNPTLRYPVYAYNTGVQQFASSIIVGETTGVVDAITGAIADLPAGVVANFKGRVIGSNAVNNNEFATLGQVTSTSRAAISLTTTGTSGPATYSSVTGILNIPEYQGGVTSFNTRTGAVTLTSSDVTTALGYTPVTDARTLTINGVTYDLTANRTWTVAVNPSAREIQTYIATSGQTVFTVTGGYTVGLVDVFINGVRLTSSDYAATNGTTVVLVTPTMVGNIVDIIKYTSGFTNPIAGTLSTGQVAFGTDTNTIGGENTLFWDAANDRLGIGTNTPATTLEVNGVGLFSGTSLIGNTKNGIYIYDQSILSLAGTGPRPLTIQGQTLSIYTGNTYSEKVKVFENGNVVISTSPTDNGAKLQVIGGGTYIKAGNGNQIGLDNSGERFTQITFNNNTVGKANIWWDNTNTELVLLANSAGTGHLRIASTGAATFSSSVTLSGTNSQLLQTISNSIAGDNAAVFYNSNANSYGLYIGAGSGTNHALYITDSTRTKNLFKVEGNGNVGIGTATPSTVKPTTTFGWASNLPSIALEIAPAGSSLDGANAGLFLRSSNAANGFDLWADNFFGDSYLDTRGNAGFIFRTNTNVTAAERMRILSNGNVLIGTGLTDNGTKLQVAGTGQMTTFTHAPLFHGRKLFLYGPTSSTTINIPAEFPLMGLVTGNVWAIFGKYCGLTSGGGSEAREFYISRNTSGTWSGAEYGPTANTGGSLSNVSGSGTNLVISTTSNAYFCLELTVMIR